MLRNAPARKSGPLPAGHRATSRKTVRKNHIPPTEPRQAPKRRQRRKLLRLADFGDFESLPADRLWTSPEIENTLGVGAGWCLEQISAGKLKAIDTGEWGLRFDPDWILAALLKGVVR